MKYNTQVVLVKKSFGKVDKAFQKLSAERVAGNIHLFRVEVKKLRALLRLISTGSGTHDNLKLPGSIKKFYQLAGLIRNLQLQHQQIRVEASTANKIPPGEYLAVLDKEAAEKIRHLKVLMKEKNSFRKQEKAVIDKLKGKLPETAIEEFVRVKTAMLRILSQQPDPDEESLHRIRKLLKDLQYDWPYIAEKAASLLPRGLDDKEKLSSFTELLGDFQDRRIELSLLQATYLDKIQEQTERTELLAVRDKWQENKEKTVKEIQSVLENALPDRPPEY